MTIHEYVSNYLKQNDSILVYKEIVNLNYSKLVNLIEPKSDSILYILKSPVTIEAKQLLKQFKIEEASNGNSIGFEYTPNITIKDNHWINNHPTEKIFTLSDYELCLFDFFSIKIQIQKRIPS